MILSPPVSMQHNFGYSDVSPMHNTNLVDEMFARCDAKISLLKKIMAKRRLNEKEKASVLNN